MAELTPQQAAGELRKLFKPFRGFSFDGFLSALDVLVKADEVKKEIDDRIVLLKGSEESLRKDIIRLEGLLDAKRKEVVIASKGIVDSISASKAQAAKIITEANIEAVDKLKVADKECQYLLTEMNKKLQPLRVEYSALHGELVKESEELAAIKEEKARLLERFQ